MEYKCHIRNNLDIKREDTCFSNNGKDDLIGNSFPHYHSQVLSITHTTTVTHTSDKGSYNLTYQRMQTFL